MAINPHDDYEKLAKLLYPSIEASGNVYYGQTRKLTIDEVLKKNELGFNSHVESFRIDETDPYSDYETFLCWELGPLKGSVRVPNILPDVPMCFAKYELSIVKENINSLGLISSGQYSVYEYNTKAIFKSIEITRGKNPIDNSNDWDGANFYIETTPSANYLYIALKVPYSLDEDIEQNTIEIPEYVEGNEFALVYHYTPPVDWSWPITIELKSNGNIANKTVYEYKVNSGQWVSFTADSTIINTSVLSDGDIINIRHKAGAVKSLQTDSDFLYLKIDGRDGYFDLKGDFRSLQEDKTEIKNHEFYRFFGGPNRGTGQYADPIGCNKIVNARECVIYAEKVGVKGLGIAFGHCIYLKSTPKLYSTKLDNHCYEYMFYECTSLEEVSDIVDFKSLDRINGCHLYCMFKNCTSLKVGPKIYSKESANSLYREMFSGCTSLERMPLPAIYVKPQYASTRVFEETFSGCTSLKKAPDIIVKKLSDNHSFSSTFKNCKSLKIPPKITLQSYTEAGSSFGGLFEEMFSGCSELISSPIIYVPLNINPVNMCTNMFYECSNLKNIYLYSEVISYEAGNFNNWVYNVAQNGNFYYGMTGENELPPGDGFPYGPSGIPVGWNKLDIFKEYRDGEHDIQEHSKYRLNNYIITSGTNSDLNGKGKLSDKSNMPSASNVSNIYTPNTYNSDGSYNQEIWGYKSFNSPAQFKNGIYSEYSEIVNSELPDKTFYADIISSYETVHESVTDGYKSSFEMTDTVLCGEKSPLASISVLNAKVLNSVYGNYFYSCCDLNSCANKSKVNNSYFVGHEWPDKLYLENCASVRTVATSLAGSNPVPHTCYSILSSNVSDRTAVIELVTSHSGEWGESNMYLSAEDIYIDGKSKVYIKGNTSTDRPAKLLLSSVHGEVGESPITENYNFTTSSISSGNVSPDLTQSEEGALTIDGGYGSIIATYYGDTQLSISNSDPLEFKQAYSIINNKTSIDGEVYNSTIICQAGMGSTMTLTSNTKISNSVHGSATIALTGGGGYSQSLSLSADGWNGDTHYESEIKLSGNNVFLKGEIMPGEGLDGSTGTTLGTDDYPFKQIYGYLPTASRYSSSNSFSLPSGCIVLLHVTAPYNSGVTKEPSQIISGGIGNNEINLRIASYNNNGWGYVSTNSSVIGSKFKLITGISINAGETGLALAIRVKD